MQQQPSLLLNGEVIWQASDSSLTKELHATTIFMVKTFCCCLGYGIYSYGISTRDRRGSGSNFDIFVRSFQSSIRQFKSVWPDWVIFKRFGDKFSFISSLNNPWLLGYFEKHHFLDKNFCGYFLGSFKKHLGYFYFNIWSHWFQFAWQLVLFLDS